VKQAGDGAAVHLPVMPAGSEKPEAAEMVAGAGS
jgi:hypothetical protein